MDIRRTGKILLRGLMLRCPDCGKTGIYESLLQVRNHCTNCGLLFQREQGYFTGALYVNIAVAEGSVLLAFLICLLVGVSNTDRMFAILIGIGALTPLLFFLHSRSFWLCFDYLIDRTRPRVKPDSKGVEFKL
jgi:uncharacterized protein (DUF983 family)